MDRKMLSFSHEHTCESRKAPQLKIRIRSHESQEGARLPWQDCGRYLEKDIDLERFADHAMIRVTEQSNVLGNQSV
jgi:hypothetical protein